MRAWQLSWEASGRVCSSFFKSSEHVTKSTDPRAGLRQTYCSDIELFLSRVSCVAVLLRLSRVSCVSVFLRLSRVSCASVLLRLSSAKGRLAGGGTFATGS